MELAESKDLFDLWSKKQTPIPEKYAFGIFVQVCEAVLHLHNTEGKVHRDIKLENIVLGKDKRVKLIDFDCCENIG